MKALEEFTDFRWFSSKRPTAFNPWSLADTKYYIYIKINEGDDFYEKTHLTWFVYRRNNNFEDISFKEALSILSGDSLNYPQETPKVTYEELEKAFIDLLDGSY